jgi:hypothetical protein
MSFSRLTRLTVGSMIAFGVFLAAPDQAHAQGPALANVTPPTPTAMAFQKYGDIPVSPYTGVPDITIPLYTAKFRDISVPVTLSYHASGIKVDEDASQVGLGWVLNAGGNITRSIIGYDDFDGNTYFNSSGNNIMDFSNGQGPTGQTVTGCVLSMFNSSNPNSPTTYNYDITSYENAVPAFDFQPDQYYYNFQGHSGKFLLKRNMQAVVQNQEKIQLTPNTAGTSWHAQTADGFAYDFTQVESYHDNEFTTGGTASTHITGWYLTKITSPVGDTVTFSYTPNSNFVQTVGGYSETRDDWDQPIGTGDITTTNSGWQKGYNPGKEYNNVVLSAINFTNGVVRFYYDPNRVDLTGDLELDSVCIYEANGTTLDKTFAMGYSYFVGTMDPSFNNSGTMPVTVSNRLMLSTVTEKGYLNGQFIQNPPYTFTYNSNTSTLPAKTSFARDHWGYFNGVTGRVTLIPDPIPLNTTSAISSALGLQGTQRDPNSLFTQVFALTQITYPTGGWTQFDYESNDFDFANSQVNDHSWFSSQNPEVIQPTTFLYDIVEKVDHSASDTLDLTNEYVLPDGSYPSVTITADFRLEGGTGANCNDIGMPANVEYMELDDLNGNVITHLDPAAMNVCNSGGTNEPCIGCQSGQPVFSFTGTLPLPPGKYIWRYYVNYSSSYASLLEDMGMTVNWYSHLPPNNTNIYTGGGLRILRITDHDGVNEANNKIRKYIYDYWADKNNSGVLQEYSYGRRMSNPEYAYFKDTYDDQSQVNGSGCASSTYYSIHLMRSSDSDVPLNGSAKGAVVGYDQVTELFGENGEYGEKVYQYINSPDIVSGFTEPFSGLGLPEQGPYGSNVPTMTNGSLLQETDYANVNGNFVRVKEQINTYSTVAANENIVYGLQNTLMTANQHGDQCSTATTAPCSGNQPMTYQSLKSDWNILSQGEEKTYDQHNQGLLEDNITSYYYDNPAHMQLTRTITTNSKGELLTTHTQYPLDFTNVTGTDAFSKGVANLQNNFVINAPVEKYLQRSNSDGSNLRTTNGVLTTFNATTPTPALMYQTEVTSPITSFTQASTSSSGSTYNPAYEPVISFDTYDTYGNILQQHKVGDLNISYIWDYNSSMPVCEVRNAVQSDIAYTSFESNGSGNWAVTGTSMNTSSAITGNQSYNLSSGGIYKSGMNSLQTYVVSYWTTNSSAYSVGGTVKQGKTINVNGTSWTYFEHTVTGTGGLTITGSGSIDELRLYPAAGQMKSLTYSPLIGVTSECDAGSKINYYFYDALGRLKYIKDQDANVIKTFEYHHKGQTGN